jgi:uncharacterized protein YjbI with pentapeptide repeats
LQIHISLAGSGNWKRQHGDMPDPVNDQERNATAPIAPSAIVLLLFYIVVTVAGHSDVDLVRPDTQVSLEAAAQKVNLPSGWIFTPFLGLKLSILWFYTFAPILVLALHFELLRLRMTGERWGSALRAAGNLLAPLALFLMLWKFAPYANSRPSDPSGFQAAALLSFGHAVALIADAAMLNYASLEASTRFPTGLPAHIAAERRSGLAFTAIKQVGMLGAAALAVGTAVKTIAQFGPLTAGSMQGFLGLSDITLVAATVVILALLTEFSATLLRYARAAVGSMPRFGQTSLHREVAPMPIVLSLLVLLLVSVALPDLGRALNLAGAKLTAAEPSDILMAATMMANSPHEEIANSGPDSIMKAAGSDQPNPGTSYNAERSAQRAASDGREKKITEAFQHRLDSAHTAAWTYFGRGFDYSNWRFIGASFDGATMPLVHLDNADLSDATFIRTQLLGASMVGARLSRTVLNEANLSVSDLSCVNALQCSFRAQTRLAQAQRGNSTAVKPSAIAQIAPSSGDPCDANKKLDGPSLNGAILTDAMLVEADLSNSRLENAILDVKDAKSAKFVNSDMKGAILKHPEGRVGPEVFAHADFSHACLCGADLRGVDLSGATLNGASLRSAELTDAILPQDLHDIDFDGANIKGTTFSKDQTGGSNLRNAILSHVVQVQRDPGFKPICPLASGSP